MISCPNCGTSNPDTSVICHRCGAQLPQSAANTRRTPSGSSPSGKTYSSPAKVTHKRFGVAPSGLLLLTGGRFSFRTRDGVVFDVPVEEVTDINTPRMMLGEGFTCVIEGRKYTMLFAKVDMSAYSAAMRAGNIAGGVLAAAGAVTGVVGAVRTLADMGKARDICETWLTVLADPWHAGGRPVFSAESSGGGGTTDRAAAAPAGERACPKCGTMFSRQSVQCPNCGAIVA